MLIETPVENPPPVTEVIDLPEYAIPFCDKWGNIKSSPEKTIEQKNGSDFIIINIFKSEKGFFYGFKLKLKKLIIQKEANVIKDTPFKTGEIALTAAREAIINFLNSYSKNMIKTFLSFDKICYNQPELF